MKRMCHESADPSKTLKRRQNAVEKSHVERAATTKGSVAQTIVHAHRQTSSSDVDIHGLHAIGHLRNRDRVEFEIRVAWR